MTKKIIDTLLKSTLLFMATAVLLDLFLNQEWKAIAVAVAISWAVGEIASLCYSKYSDAKASLMKIATSVVIFIIMAFSIGVVMNSNTWKLYSVIVTATFAVAAYVSPMWQKRK